MPGRVRAIPRLSPVLFCLHRLVPRTLPAARLIVYLLILLMFIAHYLISVVSPGAGVSSDFRAGSLNSHTQVLPQEPLGNRMQQVGKTHNRQENPLNSLREEVNVYSRNDGKQEGDVRNVQDNIDTFDMRGLIVKPSKSPPNDNSIQHTPDMVNTLKGIPQRVDFVIANPNQYRTETSEDFNGQQNLNFENLDSKKIIAKSKPIENNLLTNAIGGSFASTKTASHESGNDGRNLLFEQRGVIMRNVRAESIYQLSDHQVDENSIHMQQYKEESAQISDSLPDTSKDLDLIHQAGGGDGQSYQEAKVDDEPHQQVKDTSPKSDNMLPPEKPAGRLYYYYNNEGGILSERADYMFTCSNIHNITVKRKLGHGVSKQVLLGVYEGKKVGVKMVTRNVLDVTDCFKKARRDNAGELSEKDRSRCFMFPTMKLMKEILLRAQLSHPALLRMLGYCVRSEESESTSLQEHGVVAVYEYGLRFYVTSLRLWPLRLRLSTALELADFLDYMEHSPLGSLRIADFKDAHFLLKDGKIKMTDLDDVTSLEPSCAQPHGETGPGRQRRTCSYGLKCVGGICPGHNAKANLAHMHRIFYIHLFSSDEDLQFSSELATLSERIGSLSVDASGAKRLISELIAKLR